MRVTIMERKVSEAWRPTDRQEEQRHEASIMCSTESTSECGGQISLANREHIPALETDLIMAR